MHENTVRLRDFKYIDQVTQDYGTGQIWRLRSGALDLAFLLTGLQTGFRLNQA